MASNMRPPRAGWLSEKSIAPTRAFRPKIQSWSISALRMTKCGSRLRRAITHPAIATIRTNIIPLQPIARALDGTSGRATPPDRPMAGISLIVIGMGDKAPCIAQAAWRFCAAIAVKSLPGTGCRSDERMALQLGPIFFSAAAISLSSAVGGKSPLRIASIFPSAPTRNCSGRPSTPP